MSLNAKKIELGLGLLLCFALPTGRIGLCWGATRAPMSATDAAVEWFSRIEHSTALKLYLKKALVFNAKNPYKMDAGEQKNQTW